MFGEIMAQVRVKFSASCADQMTSHMVAILDLYEAVRVLVDALGVGILNF